MMTPVAKLYNISVQYYLLIDAGLTETCIRQASY